MWRILIDDIVYYLYAEDYVPNLEYIRQVFGSYAGSDGELVPVKKATPFGEATPVKRASVYKKPSDSAELMRYAVGSGFDFVFLYRPNEAIES